MRGRALTLLTLVMLLPLPAHAADTSSAPTESVTVTGTRAHKVIQNFVRNLAAPARVAGKLTRWEDGICPQTVGLNPAAVRFINARLKAVAKQVSAPVAPEPHCTVNIEIVFTTTPQVMIDNVREKRPNLLGYADNQSQVAVLAEITRPIQAWYLTQTRDVRGNVYLDVAHRRGMPLQVPCPGICDPGDPYIYLPNAIGTSSTGSRLGNGLTSGFHHVIVAVNPTKLTDYTIGQVADYIALVALSQVAVPDACQPLASILNLLVPGCNSVPGSLTANDLAYLGGLYHMDAGQKSRIQRMEIVSHIEQEVSGR